MDMSRLSMLDSTPRQPNSFSRLAASTSGSAGGFGASQGASMGRQSQSAANLVVDDLLQGMNEWRNIQDVIRSTFKALHDVIKAQGDAVKSLERQMDLKANHGDQQASLQHKANIADVNRSIMDITHVLEGKASAVDLESKADRYEVQTLLKGKVSAAEMSNKVDIEEVEAVRESCETRILSLQDELDGLRAELRASSVTREEVLALLGKKVNTVDFEERIGMRAAKDSVGAIVSKKADKDEVEAGLKEVNRRLEALARKQEELLQKEENLERKEKELEEASTRRYREMEESLRAKHKDFETKLESVVKETATLLSEQQAEVKRDVREVEDRATKQVAKVEARIGEGLNRVELKIGGRIDGMEKTVGVVGGKLDGVEKTVGRSGEAHEEVQLDVMSQIRELENLISLSARRDDVVKALDSKADKALLQELKNKVGGVPTRANLEALVSYEVFDESLRSHEDALHRVAEMVSEIEREMTGSEEMLGLKGQVEEALLLGREVKDKIKNKSDIKDVNVLLNTKADVDEVNRALLDLNGQIHLKASMVDISSTLQEQALLNSTLIAELCLGRWIWKCQKTRGGGLVPWNLQTANSDPANLVWEKDRTHITCVAAGLYEISVGFFSQRKPSVKVLVNSEPVLSITSPPYGVTHHAGGRVTTSGRYTNSNVTGLTHVDFLALPVKARVSLLYEGDEDAEAFMGIKKL